MEVAGDVITVNVLLINTCLAKINLFTVLFANMMFAFLACKEGLDGQVWVICFASTIFFAYLFVEKPNFRRLYSPHL